MSLQTLVADSGAVMNLHPAVGCQFRGKTSGELLALGHEDVEVGVQS